ncbi:MAG TPA: winged helix DNA-binding domain-containing protein [Micromonosporaceae bacterium]|nr:winged helix DNA-binding domain-containing protein [Micromonosporaceae bacterium]
MDVREIALRRFHGQRLAGVRPADPVELVRYLGAVQAQEYALAKWSVGQRTKVPDDAAVQRAIDEGRILRTHVLRPTWHFVAAEDILWMQAATAHRVHAFNRMYYRRYGIDDELAARANDVIVRSLAGGNFLTRKEVSEALAREGIEATDIRLGLIIMRAELEGLIANGPMRGKRHTYALVSERAPKAVRLSPEEALAELARRYFAGRGPATVKDFSWWSSLTLTEARRALELIGDELVSVEIAGRTYWLRPGPKPRAGRSPYAQVVQGLDEYTIGYSESRDVANPAGQSFGIVGENVVVHSIVLDGMVVGLWRRELNRKEIKAEVSLVGKVDRAQRTAIEEAFGRYGRFAGLPVVVDWPPSNGRREWHQTANRGSVGG